MIRLMASVARPSACSCPTPSVRDASSTKLPVCNWMVVTLALAVQGRDTNPTPLQHSCVVHTLRLGLSKNEPTSMAISNGSRIVLSVCLICLEVDQHNVGRPQWLARLPTLVRSGSNKSRTLGPGGLQYDLVHLTAATPTSSYEQRADVSYEPRISF
jgi:hypothetical protein